MTICIPPKRQKKLFLITSASKIVMGSKVTEFIQEKLAEVFVLDLTTTQTAISYKLHNHVLKGTALIHEYASDMEELQSEIIFITDAMGKTKDIYRFELLQQKWETDLKQKINKKYPKEFAELMGEQTELLLNDKERFIKSFIGYSPWKFFFNGWFTQTHQPQETKQLNLAGYFGKVDLPLLIDYKTTPFKYFNDKNLVETIESTDAVLDKSQFDREAFARMLKDITGIYNIDARLEIDLEEKYNFKKDGSLDNGELFLETKVSDWYAVTSAHQIKQIEADEFEKYYDYIEEEKAAKEIQHS